MEAEPRDGPADGLTPSGRRLRIAFVCQPEYFQFTFEHDLDGDHEVRTFPAAMGMEPAALDELVAFRPDLSFFFRGEWIPDALLQRLGGIRVALSSEPFPRLIDGRWRFTRDSIVRYLEFRRIREKPYDFVFHYDEASLPLFALDGMTVSGAFALPVALETYRPTVVGEAWDLFFIGRSTPHREQWFGTLKHHHRFLHIAHGIHGPALVPYICGARINLNVHASDEVSWEPRLQMLLACSAFVISERITPNAYLRPGIDFVQVDTQRELREAVDHYLDDVEGRRRMSERGCARVRDVLGARRRYGGLIDGIEDGRFPRFEGGRPAERLEIADRLLTTRRRVTGRLGRRS